ALEEAVRAARVDVDSESTLAEQRLAALPGLALRHAAHAQLLGALDQQELQRAFALQLHRYARPRLEAAREEDRRGDALAEQALQVRRVVVLRNHLLPRLFEPYQRAADAASLQQEALHFVHAIALTSRPYVGAAAGRRPPRRSTQSGESSLARSA